MGRSAGRVGYWLEPSCAAEVSRRTLALERNLRERRMCLLHGLTAKSVARRRDGPEPRWLILDWMPDRASSDFRKGALVP